LLTTKIIFAVRKNNFSGQQNLVLLQRVGNIGRRYPRGRQKTSFFHTIATKRSSGCTTPVRSNDLDYLAGLETAGADLDVLNFAVELGLDPEDVGIPRPSRAVLGVGNRVPESSALTANIAFSRHNSAPVE
jgi:hypothetical protein